MGAGRKLNLHRDAQTPSELLMDVFNLRLVSRGESLHYKVQRQLLEGNL